MPGDLDCGRESVVFALVISQPCCMAPAYFRVNGDFLLMDSLLQRGTPEYLVAVLVGEGGRGEPVLAGKRVTYDEYVCYDEGVCYNEGGNAGLPRVWYFWL